jgi:hypothetical protein
MMPRCFRASLDSRLTRGACRWNSARLNLGLPARLERSRGTQRGLPVRLGTSEGIVGRLPGKLVTVGRDRDVLTGKEAETGADRFRLARKAFAVAVAARGFPARNI